MQVPAPFEYARASSVDEAIGLLEKLGPEARLVAGGHSLLPMMKLRLATPEHLIDINPLEPDLNYIREEGEEVRIGAMTRHRDLLEDEALAQRLPIIREAEMGIADPPVRNRGTIGGALCQADPSEDLSAVCAALNASVVIRGSGGERVIDMVEFHRGPYETAVGESEMLVEVRIPLRSGHGGAYRKVKRRAGDWAVAASAAAIWMNGEAIDDAGIALSAVNPKGVRSTRAEEALRGQPPSDEALDAAARLAAEDCEPAEDQRGPAEYKRHLAHELTLRALRGAVAQALS
jgi:aerobic carbon-monoxide dehydrogenase medium subunit